MNIAKTLLKGSLAIAIGALYACGSDSNSQSTNDDNAPESSASSEEPNSATSENPGSSASEELPAALILSFEEEMARDSLFVEASADTGFSTIESVYQNLAMSPLPMDTLILLEHKKPQNTLLWAGARNSPAPS